MSGRSTTYHGTVIPPTPFITFMYAYQLEFDLRHDCPVDVVQFFAQLAAGQVPATVPEADVERLEVDPAEMVRLLSSPAEVRVAGKHVELRGAVEATAFYMPFIALAEWLAGWSATSGLVGQYHQPALLHPTLVYFRGGKPYMLQVTGTPIGLADGEAMPVGAGQPSGEEAP